MNITDIVRASRATQLLGSGNTAAGGASGTDASGDAVTAAFRRADQRLQVQRDETSARLSTFGKLQSAVAGLQGTARAAGGTAADAGADALTRTANELVKTYNASLQAARDGQQSSSGNGAESTRARRTETELRRAIGDNADLVAALKAVGITQQSDGSLKTDATQLNNAAQTGAAALRATLVQAGKKLDATATRQLADTGNVGATLKTLNQRSQQLQARQEEQQSLLAGLQQQAASQTQNPLNGLSSNARAGLAVYRSVSAGGI